MKKLVLALVTCLIALTSIGLLRGAPLQGVVDEEISGCLSKGDAEGTYVLTDKDSGDETAVNGPASFANHAGHEVKLTGEMKEEDGKKVFYATEMQHIAASCEVGTR